MHLKVLRLTVYQRTFRELQPATKFNDLTFTRIFRPISG